MTDPVLRGEMTAMYAPADADGGTDVLTLHEGIVGWRMSLAKLAALVEPG